MPGQPFRRIDCLRPSGRGYRLDAGSICPLAVTGNHQQTLRQQQTAGQECQKGFDSLPRRNRYLRHRLNHGKSVGGKMPKKMSKNAKGFEDVKMEEVLGGTVVYHVPFPSDLKDLDKLAPIIIKFPYHTDYIHSYGQDSPFFAGLTNKKLLGTECPKCKYRYGTPKGHCMYCGDRKSTRLNSSHQLISYAVSLD